jgi:hypothetical protein
MGLGEAQGFAFVSKASPKLNDLNYKNHENRFDHSG